MERVNFLGVGVQKSASSWLWSVLKKHPDIWMPPRKELHYFDRSIKYPSPSFLASSKLSERLNSCQDHNVLFRNKLENELKFNSQKKNIESILWYNKYFLSDYDDEWYNSLFEQGVGRVSGEITPAYSILDKDDIYKIKNIYPKLKIILILRNPVDRAWSQARFYMTRNKIGRTDIQSVLRFLDDPLQESRGDYLKIIENWRHAFPKEQIHISFYDEIEEDSEIFIKKIYDFLGVDSTKIPNEEFLIKKINQSLSLEMPSVIKKHLEKKYYSNIIELSNLYPVFPEKWLRELSADFRH